MKHSPIVSIIIPAFNREVQIKTALNSVLEQSYDHWECIVVDDGSSDNTLNVVEQYIINDKRIKLYIRDRNPKGAATCRNIGLKNATGELVLFLDSDDYLLPTCLYNRINHFHTYNDSDFLVFPMARKIDDKIVKVQIPESKDFLVNFLSANIPWQTMCPIWKIEVLKNHNGFTEGYPRFNDPELMIRVLADDDVKFKIIAHQEYDSVFVYNENKTEAFIDKVYKSLKLLIPDAVKILKQKNKDGYIKFLALYLHLWFKYFYVKSSNRKFSDALKLISMFYFRGVISLNKSLKILIHLMIFELSFKFSKRALNRLSRKYVYQ